MQALRILPLMLVMSAAVPAQESCDLLIKNGTIYDGSGNPGVQADLMINGDRIAGIVPRGGAQALNQIDATGMAVAPGFVNMLSWATETLLVDGRALSDLRQGVTLEVMGEGHSMGPLNSRMIKEMEEGQGDLKFNVTWETLGEYLERLKALGTTVNVASFVGAATVRINALGYENRAPTPEELERMCGLVRKSMEEGAMGVASALIYAPGCYAKTDELIALCKAAAPYGGTYISHLRSEGARINDALAELITIAKEARIPAEVYHLKTAGEMNWVKHDGVIRQIEAARASGLRIGADMYCYTAGATGLDAAMPPWVQEGGYRKWAERLKDPEVRARVVAEMRRPARDWENLLHEAGGAKGVKLVGFKSDALKPLIGKSLAEVASERGKSAEETAMDLVMEDGSRVECVYFLMKEENVEKQIQVPWITFCSDAGAPAPEKLFLKSRPHPRAYGNFARLLGRYVRDRKLVPLEAVIRRLSKLPCENLGLRERGVLGRGYFADVVVFDPAKIQDHATYDDPHRLATGVQYVVVNGVPVLREGEPTQARPGRIVRGPGWKGWAKK